MGFETSDLDAVFRSLNGIDAPLDLETLVYRVARSALEREASARAYAAGARYTAGERIWYHGQVVDVVDVERVGNPRQGSFAVIHLRTADGTIDHAVAEVPDAPSEALANALQTWGDEIREAILADPRLCSLVRTGDVPSLGVDAGVGRRRDVASGASSLFCENVLAQALPEFQETQLAQLRPALEIIKGVGEQLARSPGLSEAETWHRFVKPMVSRLGWAAEPLGDGCAFRLFPDPACAEVALARLREVASGGEGPLAVLVLAGWGKPLGFSPEGSSTGSPVARITDWLLSTGTGWGLVTNGIRWRLYRAPLGDPDVSSCAGQHFEMDLSDVVNLPVGTPLPFSLLERYHRWWTIYSASAFAPSPAGPARVDRLKSATAAYVRRVTQELRSRLLETVVPEVAGGYIIFRRQERGVAEESYESLEQIHAASLGFVYRLLFVLYAESHGLLPIDNPEYRGQSLTTQLRSALEALQERRPLSKETHRTPRYDGLLALFRNIEHGVAGWRLPSYGGGLFCPQDPSHSFLERHGLGDRVVARTLAALGETDDGPIDYAALTLQSLVRLGEGLIDDLLWVVEPSAGQVALVSPEGRPQAPSTTPLPDYVGISAIERALTQGLAARETAYMAAMDRLTTLKRRVPEDDEEAISHAAAVASTEREAVEALLGIKVLDPAMGTGTFLIHATDLLVDGILRAVSAYHRERRWASWDEDPIMAMVSERRAAVLAESERQGVRLTPELLSDDRVLGRLVVERSIYGVDLLPEAVTVGRASLGMRAFLPGAAFPSLDRHVVRGNSLVGLRISGLTESAPDKAVAFSEFAADVLATVSSAAQGCDTDLTACRRLLDLWMSLDFGNEGVVDLLRRLGSDLLPALKGVRPLSAEDAEVLDHTESIRDRVGFLHWDLAFPEVFFDASTRGDERPGFDVILGNPPALPSLAGRDSGPSSFVEGVRDLVRRPDGRIAFVIMPSMVQSSR
ncbi:MAG: hypothetical protein ACP5HS_08465 [Anaerolineae bacterium]